MQLKEKMMIIIEGPDKSGKSTFAENLSKRINLPVHVFGSPSTSKEEAITRAKFSLDNHDKFIFDGNSFLNEAIYCVLRMEDNYLADQIEMYDQLEKIGPRLVYCRPPDNYLLEHKKLGIKDYYPPKHVEEILTKQKVIVGIYDAMMRVLPHITYDFTNHGIDNFLGRIEDEVYKVDDTANQKSQSDTKEATGT